MFRITHNQAIELESLVRKLYKCDRTGISGLADADHFESRPMDAAIMVISFIHAKGLQCSETEYAPFLSQYDTFFNHPYEYNAEKEVENYIEALSEIIDKYIK